MESSGSSPGQEWRREMQLEKWVDTHAHLDSGKFEGDREAVIRRAQEAGVWPIVTIGADLDSSRAAVALAERHRGLYATVGVHPHSASSVDGGTVDTLRALAQHSQVVSNGGDEDYQRVYFKESLKSFVAVSGGLALYYINYTRSTDIGRFGKYIARGKIEGAQEDAIEELMRRLEAKEASE